MRTDAKITAMYNSRLYISFYKSIFTVPMLDIIIGKKVTMNS